MAVLPTTSPAADPHHAPTRPARRADPMLAVVIAEGVAIVLLGVLVLGLLRSHALILKALHELGAGLELEKEAGTGVTARDDRRQARAGAGRARVGGRAGDPQGLHHRPRHRRHRPRPGRAAGDRHDPGHPHPAGLPDQRLLASARPSGTSSSGPVDVPGDGALHDHRQGSGRGVGLEPARAGRRPRRGAVLRRPGSTTTSRGRPTSSTSRAAWSPARARRPPGPRCAT